MFKVVLLSTILTLAACGGDSGPASEAKNEQEAPIVTGVTDTEIVLGTHSDLSGGASIWGVGSINGARMRFDDVNAAGGIHGRQIRHVVEDTRYEVPRAIQAANKLINRNKIFAMVLAVGTPTNNAVLTQQLAAGVPNMFPLTGARAMGEPHHDLKFTQRGIYYDEIRAGVKYFAERGKEKACVIAHDSDYGQEILEAVQDQLAVVGQELVAVSAHKPTETEFTASIIKLRNAECDVVYLGTVHRDTILVLETARKMNFDATFVGQNAAYGQVVADQESGAAEGYHCFVHMVKLYKDDDLPEAVVKWWADYEDRFGEEPGLPAMEGYRAADLIVLALEKSGPNLTREAFIEAMEGITDYTDIFGYKVAFGPDDHNGVNESILSVVENGRWKTLATTISY
ncbi:MAG TPA: branched-chain amino acid ABC transporter substrate-binding protein [Gammaproteobacteria bacterium]|nr:branched-chain amino acid ABC transporter substrate-binding protein [Gammaproteobacteria bacterium]